MADTEPEFDMAAAMVQMEKCESRLKYERENLSLLTELLILYTKTDRMPKALTCAESALTLFQQNAISSSQGMALVEAAIEFWKAEKYIKKDSIRINLDQGRSHVLGEIKDCLMILARMHDAALTQRINFHLAYVKECMGQFQDALSLLSDLITAQASQGVELSFIILRAAVLLKHLSGNVQSLEYLEYLVDDPPIDEGYKKTHILALLALVYEQSGDRYIVALQRTYDELQESYVADMTSGRRQQTNQRKIEKMLSEAPMKDNSAIWEQLALQAVDRCEYVMAAEFLQMAMNKAPNKSRLLHLAAEIYCLLGEKDRSAKCAERAFVLQPQSGELRNLLLIVNPDKWRDRLRTVPTTGQSMVAKEEEIKRAKEQEKAASIMAETTSKVKKRVTDEDEGEGEEMGFLQKMALQAKQMQMKAEHSILGTPEQRAKREMEEKAKKAAADRKKAEMAASKLKIKSVGENSDIKRPRNYIDRNNGPANPVKPKETDDSIVVLDKIILGNENIHLYDPVLRALAEVKGKLAAEEEAKKMLTARDADDGDKKKKGKKGKKK